MATSPDVPEGSSREGVSDEPGVTLSGAVDEDKRARRLWLLDPSPSRAYDVEIQTISSTRGMILNKAR